MCSEGAGRLVEGRKGKRGQNLHLPDAVDHLFILVIVWDWALRRPKSSLQLSVVLEHPV